LDVDGWIGTLAPAGHVPGLAGSPSSATELWRPPSRALTAARMPPLGLDGLEADSESGD
jgi:hypothetical protein